MNQNFVICDKNVAEFAKSLYPDFPLYPISANEEHKTLETVKDICRWLLENGADRSSLLYAVGGGVTTDLTGFVAGIYKRGISYINVPTTLLSQIDAAIGGKTACNLDSYKNMIGLTHFPEDTIIYPEVLKTLPEREFRSGAAEMLKTFIIKDEGNYEKAVQVLSAETIDYKELGELIQAAGKVKREIVAIDPYEHNLRRSLNLGHSFGHAIEWYQHCPNRNNRDSGNNDTNWDTNALSHGEAVAIGTIEAAKMSESRGICPLGLTTKLVRDFTACGLPTELPCPREELLKAISKDKKVENGEIHFVFIEQIGKVKIDKISIHKL